MHDSYLWRRCTPSRKIRFNTITMYFPNRVRLANHILLRCVDIWQSPYPTDRVCVWRDTGQKPLECLLSRAATIISFKDSYRTTPCLYYTKRSSLDRGYVRCLVVASRPIAVSQVSNNYNRTGWLQLLNYSYGRI